MEWPTSNGDGAFYPIPGTATRSARSGPGEEPPAQQADKVDHPRQRTAARVQSGDLGGGWPALITPGAALRLPAFAGRNTVDCGGQQFGAFTKAQRGRFEHARVGPGLDDPLR